MPRKTVKEELEHTNKLLRTMLRFMISKKTLEPIEDSEIKNRKFPSYYTTRDKVRFVDGYNTALKSINEDE